jgi:hypothetical protein
MRERPEWHEKAGRPHRQFSKNLLAKLRGFARPGQQRDDVTALVMRYRGGGLSV